MTSRARHFVLVHSPIVGPDTWGPVAEELRARGHTAVVPVLDDDGEPRFWRQHAEAAARAVEGDLDEPLVLVAHSGAGQLLGHLGARLAELGGRVAAYLLADAGVPTAGASRLEQLRGDEPEIAAQLESLFAAGDRYPNWTEEQLVALVPDPVRRQRLHAGIRRQPEAYWREPIPAVPGWPDAPCGVLLLSDGYEATARVAAERGWPVRRLDARNHFFLLVDPGAVADALEGLAA